MVLNRVMASIITTCVVLARQKHLRIKSKAIPVTGGRGV
jgi:hypothetical protein